jgi:hypothetical protein
MILAAGARSRRADALERLARGPGGQDFEEVLEAKDGPR